MNTKELEPFQTAGATFLASRYHALLADEPGLGKTVQAIAAVKLADLKTILVVCPASVRSSWWEHVVEWGAAEGRDWKIVSYEQAVKMRGSNALALDRLDCLILDEGHYLKTIASKRTQAIFGLDGLARKGARVWVLTGTPLLNRPLELYPVLKCLHPAFAKFNALEYQMKFCGAYYDGYGINAKGATNLEELSRLVSSEGFMLRRTKREVYPERQDPLLHPIPLDLSVQDMAEVIAEEDAIGGREARLSSSFNQYSALGDTSKLLHLLGKAKVKRAVDFILDELATVEKVVVFAYHTEVIVAIHSALLDANVDTVVYQGGMADWAKDSVIKSFSEGASRVFIGQRNAAGTGINGLQRVCSTAIFVECPWGPEELKQNIGRLDRMGQEDELVTAYLLYAKGTLDEVVKSVRERKEVTISRVIRTAYMPYDSVSADVHDDFKPGITEFE